MERLHSYKYIRVWLTSILSWSMQVSKVCKKARQQVGILYRTFYPSANTSSLWQLYLACIRPHLKYGAPVWDPYQQELTSTPWRECRSLHWRCAPKTGVYVSVMQPAHPCQQKIVYETVLTLSNCQWTSKFPYCTHCTTKPVQISQKHQYTLALEWPVTCMNASFFPHTITLWNSLPPHVYKTSSHCVPLNKLYFVTH